ncbi:hypothetical protein Csa_007384 [Cucumis sativus]|nr:hypothetical protein Csa_007384 [Cucumis sativus]
MSWNSTPQTEVHHVNTNYPYNTAGSFLEYFEGLTYEHVVWQDNVDPDNMTYEELLELGETVGTQSRGLSQELIALLPISKYKYSFFSRKKSRGERWNINEVIDGSLCRANISTMLVVEPNGLASTRPAPYVTQRYLVILQNAKSSSHFTVLDDRRT